MQTLGKELVIAALQATGQNLAAEGVVKQVRVIVCGSVAGILHNDLGADRRTVDCDMVQVEPDDAFAAIERASATVAQQMDLKTNWLNRESRVFAYLIPPGWTSRLRAFDTFGPLEVVTISRRDLLGMKLRAISKRSADLVDIETMKPTADEVAFLLDYLDQAESESLDRETFDDQRDYLLELKRSHES